MFSGFFSRFSLTGSSTIMGAQSSTSPTEAISKLKDMIVELEKKEKYIYKKIENELEIARDNATKNKRGIVEALS
ncbi:hypothetical protein DI09_6p110 [Mitosporidium daphniae]|uniref:Uncharacterized protein n=1 Tax=Mitosporidium daphniae TaxID=1485682 RepID=A0A098VM44_9MICR|nr:uncharacterized protein DI09_86p70 [Mitosporidium daphniae]XP_013236854.1 uncharacterized protein DI09_6p110 [Mitosporidium daphniae]KGG50143.1 hypothetical protein DI09_86p70 [Mitosporidium daphniae]KGG50427.1 hypothetical protein DI09_6p110 [Mitosporidium daphniae]|eukprot:XP_013236583.1 uncharacterized protein DI09_86p70 [Mitosporidium daphniae]